MAFISLSAITISPTCRQKKKKNTYENNLRGKCIVTWLWCVWVLDWWSDLLYSFDTAPDYFLQFTVACACTHRHTYTKESTVMSSLALSPASATIFSQEQLTMTQPQQFSDWLTDWFSHSPTNWTHSPLTVLLITSRHGPCRKHRSLLLSSCLFCGHCLVPGLHATISSHSFIGSKVLISTAMLCFPQIN
jgi:hypothetical protein